MSTDARVHAEAAVRTGTDLPAAYVAELLADRDALAVARDQLGVAHDRAVADLERLERRVTRARAILDDPRQATANRATLTGRIRGALDGDIR